jgi:hypothetical protein
MREKYTPLTPKMIRSLLIAIEKQKKRIPFGPVDIKGSVTTLIKRGLISRQKIKLAGHIESQWQVTEKAMNLLKNLDIKPDTKIYS